MFNVQRLTRVSALLAVLLVVGGCGDSSPRQVNETSQMSFEDVAAQIDAENQASDVKE